MFYSSMTLSTVIAFLSKGKFLDDVVIKISGMFQADIGSLKDKKEDRKVFISKGF